LPSAVGAYGIASSVIITTASLFLADAVHASALLIGLYFAGRGLFAIILNQLGGWVSDRLSDRRVILALSGVAGAVGALCLVVLRDYALVFLTGTILAGLSGIGFPQAFAYTRELAEADGRPVTAFSSAIRSVFSAAWVIGPPAGFFLLARYGFGTTYTVAAALFLAGAVLGRWRLRELPRSELARPAGSAGLRAQLRGLPSRTALLLAAVVALGMAGQMYTIDVALYVTRTVHLGTGLAGWLAGLAAALEIPFMLIIGRYADRIGKLRVVLAGAVVYALFFCLVPLSTTAPELLAVQLLNGASYAVLGSIPMVMVQDEMRGGVGASTGLYQSAFMASALFGGAVAGVVSALTGFRGVFWVCAAFSLLAVGMLAARARLSRR
jgi:MFS transporter, SET family, sugar efflux transporter